MSCTNMLENNVLHVGRERKTTQCQRNVMRRFQRRSGFEKKTNKKSSPITEYAIIIQFTEDIGRATVSGDERQRIKSVRKRDNTDR